MKNSNNNNNNEYLYNQESIDYMLNYYETILKSIEFAKRNNSDALNTVDANGLEQDTIEQIELLKRLKNQKIDIENIDCKQEYIKLLNEISSVYYPLSLLFMHLIYPTLNSETFNHLCLKYGINSLRISEFADALKVKLGSNIANNQQNNSIENVNADPNYKVGRGHPPLETRFQKGNKGNPKGRKSKKNMSIMQLLFYELNKEISIQKDGEDIKVSKLEYMVMHFVQELIKGELKTTSKFRTIREMDTILERYKRFGLL